MSRPSGYLRGCRAYSAALVLTATGTNRTSRRTRESPMPAIRVLIQANHAEPDAVIPALNEHAKRARGEPGCLQFEFFRSGDITENLLQLELWESVAAFDDHWQKHPESAFMLAPANQLQSPYHYGSPERPRRHGDSGVEFYRHAYSRVSDGVWLPTDESQLPRTIRWPSYTGVRIINQSTEDPATAGDRTRYINDTRAEPGCTQFEQFRSVEFPVHTGQPRAVDDATHLRLSLPEPHHPATDRHDHPAAAGGAAHGACLRNERVRVLPTLLLRPGRRCMATRE